MVIGVPREIKPQEGRVSATPAVTHQLVQAGHTVLVEAGAGVASSFSDEEYEAAGAEIVENAADVWNRADLIYKVKEPLQEEFKYFREDLIIYTYLHLASAPELTDALIENKTTGIAFETVQIGRATPLLRPMSEVAGRLAIQEGAKHLQQNNGGLGLLLGGVPGVRPGNVVVVGGGIVGTAAVRIAVGMGARVTVLDNNLPRLAELVDIFGNDIETLYSNSMNIASAVKDADLVVSTVLIPGHKAPQLITEEMVKTMKEGSVIVDVAIDQGGSTELTARHGATTHKDPVFVEYGVINYAVGNMPGAVPRTSTMALANATSQYLLLIANSGLENAIARRPELALGINTINGKVTNQGVAEACGKEFVELEEAMKA